MVGAWQQVHQGPGLHGKFLVWDSDNLVITSFNWLSTAIRGYQQGASEIGILISSPGLGDALLAKLIPAAGARYKNGPDVRSGPNSSPSQCRTSRSDFL